MTLALGGFAFGLAVAGFNHALAIVALRVPTGSPQATVRYLSAVYLVRMITSFVALFLVRNEVPALLGTLAGLIAFRYGLLLLHLREERRGNGP